MKIITQTVPGAICAIDYEEAETRAEPPFLIITHRDPQGTGRKLSRVPLQNVVQILEDLPDKAS